MGSWKELKRLTASAGSRRAASEQLGQRGCWSSGADGWGRALSLSSGPDALAALPALPAPQVTELCAQLTRTLCTRPRAELGLRSSSAPEDPSLQVARQAAPPLALLRARAGNWVTERRGRGQKEPAVTSANHSPASLRASHYGRKEPCVLKPMAAGLAVCNSPPSSFLMDKPMDWPQGTQGTF